jgi:subtilisin family serine protease
VVIAANGNYGPNASTVASPGIAHKAIGVGAVDVQSGSTPNYQSRGPAPDGRIKPDIQAPTNTETAGNASDNALRNFGGTSGATPYAAGVAALLRNWMRGGTGSIDPGKVHAFMILAGRDPFPFDNTTGTGELRLPVSGTAWWGKVSVRNGQTIEIPITVPAGRSLVDAALWWPESASQDHNDIDLSIVDPSGTVRSSSVSVPSVFERARAQGGVAAGGWKIRVRGFNVRTAAQDVYWAVHAGS